MSTTPPRKKLSHAVWYHDGQVGYRDTTQNVIITSPNTPFIVVPFLGERNVSMLANRHFGLDDPLFHPQPFNTAVAHLAFIPFPVKFPSLDQMLWFHPKNPNHFESTNQGNAASGIGLLSHDFRTILKDRARALQKRLSSERLNATDEIRKLLREDAFLRDVMPRLKHLSARLDLPASFEECVMVWCMMQRIILEVEARLTWLLEARRIYYDPIVQRQPLRNVVGAFTDQMEVAESLYRCGVPLWLIRRPGSETNSNIVKWIENDPPERPMDITISYAHASPPYPVIFTGFCGSLERYRAMAHFIRKLASPLTIIHTTGTALLAPSGTSASLQSLSAPLVSSSSKTLSNPSSQSIRYTPYPPNPNSKPKLKPKSKSKSKQPAKAERDRFSDAVSPLMPPALIAWTTAMDRVKREHDPKRQPPPGMQRGFALPNPNVLANVENDATRAALFCAYVKLRSLLHYRLQSQAFNPWAAPEWRRVLGLEIHPSTGEGWASQAHNEIKADLARCLIEGQLQGTVNLANLNEMPILYRGVTLAANQVPCVEVAQQILWELFEVNFRYDLLVLNRACYDLKPEGFDAPRPGDEDGQLLPYDELDASLFEDRQMRVLGAIPHFKSRMVPEDSDDGHNGFASPDVTVRRDAFCGLYRVMQGWRRVPPLSQHVSAAAQRLLHKFLATDLAIVEVGLAYHFANCYITVIGHPPLLPHGL